ncbi:hypothetical protein C455_07125 [Haloferax larsenii JCM 13917]|nr:hypothetical protein [Haloferax larsenii]ELZ80118.1 hypothetical protein C455_07125 [Haloferax larsenii JCM 13917]
MNDSEKKLATEEEEREIRDEIEEFTHSTSGSPTLLHIPDGDTTDPLCGYTKGKNWRREPVTAFPAIGYRELCRHCAAEFFEERR